jgi:hypothetical protein
MFLFSPLSQAYPMHLFSITTPDKLYTAIPTQRSISKCKNKEVNGAIFYDKYGVWFSDINHEWYEKIPTRSQKKNLTS